MTRRQDISFKCVRELLHYDPDTGILTRLIRTSMRIKIGDVAGSKHCDGYLHFNIEGKLYLAHRVIWLWMTGAWPKDKIDHWNLDRADNRWVNLRAATNSQNGANRLAQKNNSSGLKGISWDKRASKWQGRIVVLGKHKSLGYFDCPATAHFAYIIAADKVFGEFARAA